MLSVGYGRSNLFFNAVKYKLTIFWAYKVGRAKIVLSSFVDSLVS